MEKYLGIEMTAQAFADLIAAQKAARLELGQSRVIYLYILPAATWGEAVKDRYGDLEPRRFVLRDLRSQVKMGGIVADQVDVDGRPSAYGAIYKRDVLYAYAVPGDIYWRALVEGEGE